MSPFDTPNAPLPQGGYVPYFYESGAFQRYGQPAASHASPVSYGSDAVYDFSSTPPRWRRSDHSQTVEQIIAHGYLAVPKGASDTALLADKQHAAWLGLDDVITQIRQRYDLYSQNMYELDLSICEANNEVHRIERDRGQPANDKQRYAAHKQTQDVYQEKRDQRVNLWRDVVRIRSDLPEMAQSYLAAYRKLSILQDIGGDVL